ARNMVYILEDCGDLDTCQAIDTDGAPMSVARYVADDERTIFIVVDYGYTTNRVDAFTLQVTVDYPTECNLGEQVCAADGTAIEYCNAYGVWDRYACGTDMCADGLCTGGDGDLCQDAEEVFAGSTVSGDMSASRTRALRFGDGTFGQCELSGTVQGNESIYRIELEEGEVLRAEMTSGPNNGALYILEDCFAPDTCLSFDNSGSGSLVYHTAERDGSVYVVADRMSTVTTSSSFSVEFDVQKACIPDERTCIDATTLGYCNWAGYMEARPCAGGCSGDACGTAAGDYCADAMVLEPGVTVTGNWDGEITFAPGSGTFGQCTIDQNIQGIDTFYAVDVLAGEVVLVDFESEDWLSGLVYIVEDCLGIDSCVAYAGRNASRLYYEATEDRRIYVVVDSSSSSLTLGTDRYYTLHMSKGMAGECAPGARQCMGDDALYCSGYGFWERVACDEGGCEEDRCAEPLGDHCGDPIVINASGSFSTGFADATRSINPGVGTCVIYEDEEPVGQDRIFAVDLQAGEILRASIGTTNFRANMYILDSCIDDVSEACKAHAPRRQDLEFLAEATGTYYLVVDSYDLTPVTQSIALEIDIEQTNYVCMPGQTFCDDAGSELIRCVSDGGGFAAAASCESGCQNDMCAGPPAAHSTCEDAYHITASTRIFDDLNRFENSYNPGSGGCSGRITNGSDAVYRVSLGAGQALRASSYIYGDGTSALYAFTDCEDFDGTCAASDDGINGVREITYVASEATELYVILGASAMTQNDVYYIDFDIVDTECAPGQAVCINPDSIQRCDETGQFVTELCDFGCANDACQPPTNDTCEGAVDATAGIDMVLDIEEYTDTYDLGDSMGSCIGQNTPGQDAFFYVDAARNDVISVRANTGGNYNSAIWISTECSAGAPDACVGGIDITAIGTPDDVDFIAPEAGRYYIVIDSRFANNTGTVRVQIDVEGPECTEGSAFCEDGDTLMACATDGSGFVPYACDGGCSGGFCGTPRGDICADVVPVSASATFLGNFGQFTNASDPGFGGCTGFEAPGPDAIFAVELQVGQTLGAVLSNVGGATTDLSLYMVWDCTDPSRSCLIGSDAYGAVDELIVYTATENEVLFLVADTWNVGANTEFALSIDIQ
ncbi:MAG: hypothetical protein ACNA8W_00850, partial [Bradymonadaceae bacterium]